MSLRVSSNWLEITAVSDYLFGIAVYLTQTKGLTVSAELMTFAEGDQ
jgi:hypothetical protein